MFTEDTGRDYLDSGDSYGRHRELNRLTSVKSSKPITELTIVRHNAKAVELTCVISLFHLLNTNLDYDKYMDDKFQKFVAGDTEDRDYLELMPDFPLQRQQGTNTEALNEYEELYSKESAVINTSDNNHSLLSQEAQYVMFNDDDCNYMILQIHNGADVRGGYTRPVVFIFGDVYSQDIFNQTLTLFYENEHTCTYDTASCY